MATASAASWPASSGSARAAASASTAWRWNSWRSQGRPGARRSPAPVRTTTSPTARRRRSSTLRSRLRLDLELLAGPDRVAELVERDGAAVGDEDADEPLRVARRDHRDRPAVVDRDRLAHHDEPASALVGRRRRRRRPDGRHGSAVLGQPLQRHLQRQVGAALAERRGVAEAERHELALASSPAVPPSPRRPGGPRRGPRRASPATSEPAAVWASRRRGRRRCPCGRRARTPSRAPGRGTPAGVPRPAAGTSWPGRARRARRAGRHVAEERHAEHVVGLAERGVLGRGDPAHGRRQVAAARADERPAPRRRGDQARVVVHVAEVGEADEPALGAVEPVGVEQHEPLDHERPRALGVGQVGAPRSWPTWASASS